jgi:hypothetical protein
MMNRLSQAVTAVLFLTLATIVFTGKSGRTKGTLFVTPSLAAVPYQTSNPCAPPTQMAATPEQTAWQLFVAATCPVNNNKYPYVVWENWIEQSNLYSPNLTATGAAAHRLHGSPLAAARRSHGNHRVALTAGVGAANQNCNSQTVSGRTICEEVRLNPDAQKFITSTGGGIQKRANQAKMAANGSAINFTPGSIEIKADWIVLPSCTNPPAGVHVEQIGTTCYALGGMHLISKLAPNWVWATFEPQNLSTNPQRCVVLGCSDSFGSNPTYSQGGASGNTQQTPQLKALMTAANLAPEWYNYRLDGVQMNFNNTNKGQIATATLLGNSIIEGDNVGMPMLQASCITCHSVSTVASNGADGIAFLGAAEFNPVGSEQAVPAASGNCKWIQRDFVWSLLLAYPSGPAGCTSSTTSVLKKRK